MTNKLSRDRLSMLPGQINIPKFPRGTRDGQIMHFGVGGFHRAHQAFALQQLINRDPEQYGSWSIIGVCILPQDEGFVQRMRQQDLLYTLKISPAKKLANLQVIGAISKLLLGPQDYNEVIWRLADSGTKVLSFTITEGGYNIEESSGRFLIEHPDIQWDLNPEHAPRTVFGYLARGLQKRMELGGSPLTLLSCDNIQENGNVLKKALLCFLDQYNTELSAYLRKEIKFLNSMVDRITPATRVEEIEGLEKEFGYRDNCLVVSEDFFQWVIEDPGNLDFPPLDLVGAQFVRAVKPFEYMKLGLLNGPHSLVGLVGDGLGYSFIHEAVRDPMLRDLFEHYVQKEVIPNLHPIKGIDYPEYARQVKARFENPLILDTTARIISGSSGKLPKFVFAAMKANVQAGRQVYVAALIVAAWWFYLRRMFIHQHGDQIQDTEAIQWEDQFIAPNKGSLLEFIGNESFFDGYFRDESLRAHFKTLERLLLDEGMPAACRFTLNLVQ